MKLISNSFLNLAGNAIPALIGIPVIGLLARLLGVEQFGLFLIIFSIIGYANILELGMSRTLIREIAILDENNGSVTEFGETIGTALSILMVMGGVALVFLLLFSDSIVAFLSVPEKISNDVTLAICLSGMAIPFLFASLVITSIAEGKLKFFHLNVARVVTGSVSVILPLLFVWIENDIVYAVIGLLLSKVISLIFLWYFFKSKLNFKIYPIYFSRTKMSQFFNFGGWLTISSIVNPIMVYFDRFIVSNLLGAKIAGYYVAASELIARLSILPLSISRVTFALISRGEKSSGETIRRKSYFLILFTLLPIVLGIYTLSELLVDVWLGGEYTEVTSDILEVLVIGFFSTRLLRFLFLRCMLKAKRSKLRFCICVRYYHI